MNLVCILAIVNLFFFQIETKNYTLANGCLIELDQVKRQYLRCKNNNTKNDKGVNNTVYTPINIMFFRDCLQSCCPDYERFTKINFDQFYCNQPSYEYTTTVAVAVTMSGLVVVIIICIACRCYRLRKLRQLNENPILIVAPLQSPAVFQNRQYQPQLKQNQIEDQKLKRQDNTCPICLYGDVNLKTGCNHYFHLTCMKQWVQNKNNCPLCKQSLITTLKYYCISCAKNYIQIPSPDLPNVNSQQLQLMIKSCQLCKKSVPEQCSNLSRRDSRIKKQVQQSIQKLSNQQL